MISQRKERRIAEFSSVTYARVRLGTLTLLLGACAFGGVDAFAAKAFPTAEGFGANAVGGRGGDVYHVTSLADSGAGSLRACVQASGPRTCVFRVSGTIMLQSQLSLGGGYLTIAGQTAPGDGITLRAHGGMAPGALLRINRDHVIVRHMRFRRGASGSTSADRNDAVQLLNANNVILDHVSISWGVDENLGISNTSNVTVQWSIISEGLYDSNHPKGPHSMGTLLYGDNTGFSLHHNIFAHNQERNPRVKINGYVDLVNNTIFNSGTEPIVITNEYGDTKLNFVNNTYKKGPDSPGSDFAIRALDKSGGSIAVFSSGNSMPNGVSPLRETEAAVDQPFSVPAVTRHSASDAFARVASEAGAKPRDNVDDRIVSNVASGAGSIIDSPNQVGGWPQVSNGTPYLDADKDGMEDGWEAARGLSSSNPNDRNGDRNGDGYTNLEEFLNDLADGTTSSSGTSAPPTDTDDVAEDDVVDEPPEEVDVAEDPIVEETVDDEETTDEPTVEDTVVAQEYSTYERRLQRMRAWLQRQRWR